MGFEFFRKVFTKSLFIEGPVAFTGFSPLLMFLHIVVVTVSSWLEFLFIMASCGYGLRDIISR